MKPITLANPYDGQQVRLLQEELYKHVKVGVSALNGGDKDYAYYLLRCAGDIVDVLRPGYRNDDESKA